MPGKNKNPLLGWHPPAELQAFVREEAEMRMVSISFVLNEALAWYKADIERIRENARKPQGLTPP